jgi:hypothetical protein
MEDGTSSLSVLIIIEFGNIPDTESFLLSISTTDLNGMHNYHYLE